MTGPGKYDDLCTRVRVQAKARGVILIVIGGEHGDGFSAQLPPECASSIPVILLDLAQQIARDTAAQRMAAATHGMKATDKPCAVCGQPYDKHTQPGDFCPVNYHHPGRSYFRAP